MKLFTVALATAMVAVSGCRCGGTTPPRSMGEIRIVYTDETGATLAGENGTYDFGQVSMGKTENLKLVVTNSGLGTLTLTGFEKFEGDAVLATPGVTEANPIFTVTLGEVPQVDIPSGSTQEFDITFTPPLHPTEKQVEHRSVVTLKASNTEPGKESAQITLLGVGVSGQCDLPDEIDFGAVARGDTYSHTETFDNTQPIDTRAYVGDVESAQGTGIFTFTPDSPRGEFTILAGRSKDVTIVFSPTEARDYFGSVRMRKADGCPEKQVRLIGTGVDQVLSWTPSTVDFGYVTPGLTVEGEVTFANQGLKPVELTMLATYEGSVPSAVFKVTEATMGDLTRQTVPAATRDANRVIVPGTAKVKMSFKPLVLGPRPGTLRANTDLRNQSSIVVPLRGVGGGPDIEVRPSPLNFGRIAYFQGANPPSFASRRLTVQNMRTRPTPPDPRANLKLGKPDGMGGYVKPYWEVTPKNADSSLSEICLGTFDTMTNMCLDDLPATGPGRYDPGIGLEANGTAALLDIPIRITPNGLGMKEWEVKIFSNDPDEPVTTVTVTANSVVLPPCNVQVSPSGLNYGVVSPPNTKDLGFQIRNMGTQPSEICLITNLQLQPETGTPTGMPPVFSLPAGEVNERELMPGEVMQVLVRAWPQGQLPPNPATVTGRVQFNVSNPISPQGNVSLTATIAPSCLTISPSDLDFGTVQKDCNSPDRNFEIYNTCSTAVTITSTAMLAAAGEPPGGPNCAGTSPCPEFFITANIPGLSPSTPITINAGAAPLTFRLKYRPINYGPDTGAFVVRATQGGQMVDYVVTLRGQGDTMGLNTDTFRQDSKPKADILLVIDDSCSMSDKQMALAANFNSFIKYAQSSQVDFQIGVTTTDPGSSVKGRLKTAPAGMKILKPTTPNLEQQFAAVVNVGISGSGIETCMDPAVAALTAPLITDPAANLGLLRQDAVLAVVCVTDANDQAVQAPAFYLNQLQNIKGAQRPGLFTYNVVGPFLPSSPSGCLYDGADDGRHVFMVNSTNGVREEICTPDWAKALENIGKNAFGFRTNFYLTARPDLTAMRGIEVGIDSVPCPMTGCPQGQTCSTTSNMCILPPTDSRGAKVWEYDPTNNSVNFEPLYVPEPGKTLTVTYQVACIP
ncbi:MAG: hypothetical protein AB1938_00845 [Myxococcota bacterium]